MRERVVVEQLRIAVVARVDVAAPAVGVAATDRHVVVARDALDVVLAQERPDRVALCAEPAEVAEAEDALAPAPARVEQERAQGPRVRVGATKGGDPRHRRVPAAASAMLASAPPASSALPTRRRPPAAHASPVIRSGASTRAGPAIGRPGVRSSRK